MNPRSCRFLRSGTLPAAALAAVLVLGGCGNDPAERHGIPPGTPRAVDQPQEPGVDRALPGATAAAYFEAVAEGRFADACSLLAPVVQQRYASAGQDCQTEMAGLFDEPTRAAIGQVDADESAVEVVGDTAVIPGRALSRTDLPDGAPAPAFPDLRATRQDGSWHLLP